MQATPCSRDTRIAAVLCDMDNTLFDLVGAKREACRSIVEYIGAGDPEALFRLFLSGAHGFEHHNNIRDFLEILEVYHGHTYRKCCRIYEEVKLANVEPYAGVEETLRSLQDGGIRLAIVTDAGSLQAGRRLRKTGLIDFFEAVVTPEVSGKRKPEPDSLLLALQRLDAEPAGALMVGDSPTRDIAPGRHLGMMTAFAAYGDWRSERITDSGADVTLQEFAELLVHLGLEGSARPCSTLSER
jgi:putative hydrolase of the HAD superfamily